MGAENPVLPRMQRPPRRQGGCASDRPPTAAQLHPPVSITDAAASGCRSEIFRSYRRPPCATDSQSPAERHECCSRAPSSTPRMSSPTSCWKAALRGWNTARSPAAAAARQAARQGRGQLLANRQAQAGVQATPQLHRCSGAGAVPSRAGGRPKRTFGQAAVGHLQAPRAVLLCCIRAPQAANDLRAAGQGRRRSTSAQALGAAGAAGTRLRAGALCGMCPKQAWLTFRGSATKPSAAENSSRPAWVARPPRLSSRKNMGPFFGASCPISAAPADGGSRICRGAQKGGTLEQWALGWNATRAAGGLRYYRRRRSRPLACTAASSAAAPRRPAHRKRRRGRARACPRTRLPCQRPGGCPCLQQSTRAPALR